MFLVCGLGNPGAEYLKTRHNIGFLFIDYLLSKLGIDASDLKNKYNSLYIKEDLFGKEVVVLKPQTFMNNSGVSVYEVSRFYKILPKNVIIIHDELDIGYGNIKTKFSGGHAGHNGLRSIDKYITNKYHRIRLGIDHPRNTNTPLMPVSNYVLSNFSLDEFDKMEELFIKAEKILEGILHQD